MKRLFAFVLLLLFLTSPVETLAQPIEGGQSQSVNDDHTAREEIEGKEIWGKLQAKQLECKNLTDDNFEVLGEYFMGQMVGSSHETMNNMMKQMMGKEGEEQMHKVLGKRLSGCDLNTSYPSSGFGFMPMMGMMGSAFASQSFGGTKGGGNPMSALSGGWGLSGSLFWLFWIVALIDLILLAIWLWKKIKKEK